MKRSQWKTVFALAFIVSLSLTQIAAGQFDETENWQEVKVFPNGVDYTIIKSPPPPTGGFTHDTEVSLPAPDIENGINTLTVPALDWYMGCSAVSGAMIAGFYDRNGYANMYTGPTNGGVFPLPVDSTMWGTFTDSEPWTYSLCPLIGSRNGLDGRVGRGSADDYWVMYGSYDDDPYITNGWIQHTWGTAIGDYMKTSQSEYGYPDGATGFWGYGSATPLTCATMASNGWDDDDGTYGVKLFYEARGYTVTDCYNQKTDNQYAGGFSFAQYMAEIDAGHPVMIHVVGHTMAGVGYNTTGNVVYLHDTWDWSTHSMTWGGYYDDPSYGLLMRSVSIVHLATPAPPGAFGKSSPVDGASITSTGPTLYWGASAGADYYIYCVDTIDNGVCDTSWQYAGTATSAALSGLSNTKTYYWFVAATNGSGTTYADAGTWWDFTVKIQTFSDVPTSHWAWSYIERLFAAGITGGCGTSPLRFCPNTSVTRAEMPIFLERGMRGSAYTPPAATGTVFSDVPISYWSAAWIEKLYADGITGGCGGGKYCPAQAVTRAEMAIFLLRAEHGAAYTPPAATGTVFTDVPISYWAAAWIEQLNAEGITGGCGGGNFCPSQVVTRAEMAVFLVRTFGLP